LFDGAWRSVCLTVHGEFSLCDTGQRATDGVPDMTAISDIDVEGVNVNLRVRFERDEVSVSNLGVAVANVSRLPSAALLIALPYSCTAQSVGVSVRFYAGCKQAISLMHASPCVSCHAHARDSSAMCTDFRVDENTLATATATATATHPFPGTL
jgi:hypothetical protein